MEWQPIETVPMKNTKVLLWAPWFDGLQVGMGVLSEVYGGSPARVVRNDLSFYPGGFQATHWMPLPQPPVLNQNPVDTPPSQD